MKIGAGPGRPSQEVRGKEGLYIGPSTRTDQDHLARTDCRLGVSVKQAPSRATQTCNVSCFSANSAMQHRSARSTFFPSDATTALAFWVDHYWMHAISTMP